MLSTDACTEDTAIRMAVQVRGGIMGSRFQYNFLVGVGTGGGERGARSKEVGGVRAVA